MKILFWGITLIFFVSFGLNAQDSAKKHSIVFHAGIILVDGFVYEKSPPVVGLGYSYKLTKIFSIDASLISMYRTLGDAPFVFKESVNIITRNTNSILISQEDRDKITNVGIKDLYSDDHVKYLYLPLSLCLNINPLKIGRSSLGFGIGATATYGSYKASRDQFQMNITLKDGTVFENLTFLQEVEFRNLIIGASYSKLNYKYDLGKNAIQLSLHSLNFFWSYRNTHTNHLLTLDFNSSF